MLTHAVMHGGRSLCLSPGLVDTDSDLTRDRTDGMDARMQRIPEAANLVFFSFVYSFVLVVSLDVLTTSTRM